MADVELKNITKIYDGSNKAVDDVSIRIEDKEFVVLVGPSGCGKSTTLRMIAGLEDISSGDIFIDGKRVNDISPKDRNIAMVFQNYALYPHMTVYENMAFGLKLRKMPKEEIKERVEEAARILDLQDYLDRKPKALSGGQRQRVAVGRAIVRKPSVFLFDEPLSNLDAKLRVQMRTEISKLHNRLNATMIYVTHDQTEAMTMGDKIVLMKDGIVHQVDAPLKLYNYPANKFVAGFIGSPAMNFIDGNITADGTHFVTESGKLNVSLNEKQKEALKNYKGKKVSAGVRPEDINDNSEINHSEQFMPVNVVLDVVEPMGNEIFLYFNIETNPFVSRIPAHEIPDTNSAKDLFLNVNKFHFFDPDSEIVIS